MRGLVRALLILVGLAALVWAGRALAVSGHLSVAGLRALVHGAGPWGPLVFMGLCVLAIFLHLPELLVIGAGAVVFGALPAFAYGWVASLLGMTATFLAVRYLAREAFQRALHGRFPRLGALDARLERHGFWTVLLLRVLLVAAPPLNWGLGATRVRLHHYLAGTALGVVPGLGTAALFGGALREGAGAAPQAGGALVVTGLVILLLAGAAVLLRRALGRTAD